MAWEVFGLDQNKITGILTKFIKIIIFVAVLIYFIVNRKSQFHTAAINMDSVSAAIMLAVLAYYAVTMFGVLMRITNSLIISIILLPIITILLCSGLDKLVKSKVMTEQQSFYLVLILGCLVVLLDLWKVASYCWNRIIIMKHNNDETLQANSVEENSKH